MTAQRAAVEAAHSREAEVRAIFDGAGAGMAAASDSDGRLVWVNAALCRMTGFTADELIGTWECTVPGAPPTKTPPIVWFGPANTDGKAVDATVDLDGFARTVSGISDLAADADGWWKVQPQDGQPFLVKPLPPEGKAVPAMALKQGSESYHCLRLPRI